MLDQTLVALRSKKRISAKRMRAIAAWDKGLYSLASRQLWHIDQVSHRKTQPIQMTQQLRGRTLTRDDDGPPATWLRVSTPPTCPPPRIGGTNQPIDLMLGPLVSCVNILVPTGCDGCLPRGQASSIRFVRDINTGITDVSAETWRRERAVLIWTLLVFPSIVPIWPATSGGQVSPASPQCDFGHLGENEVSRR